MGKVKTNFLEILLRETMLNKTIYDEEGNAIVIKHLTFTPVTNVIKISDMADPNDPLANKYKLLMKDIFEFDYELIELIIPNKKKIKGKKKRN